MKTDTNNHAISKAELKNLDDRQVAVEIFELLDNRSYDYVFVITEFIRTDALHGVKYENGNIKGV